MWVREMLFATVTCALMDLGQIHIKTSKILTFVKGAKAKSFGQRLSKSSMLKVNCLVANHCLSLQNIARTESVKILFENSGPKSLCVD